ncbi:MAG TPA: hypothetical protein VEJ87_09165, partial [Acidimicrobiales bacterium]|nr:hypothetical protein [Acidimicrobiales bacterium]
MTSTGRILRVPGPRPARDEHVGTSGLASVSELAGVPELAGVLDAGEILKSAASIASVQRPDGMIPWFEGGHCDPWNH